MGDDEQELLSNRHGQLVWRGGGLIVREGDPERIGVHAKALKRLEGRGVTPKLLGYQEGVSQEEDIQGILLRRAPLTSEKKLDLLLKALEPLHEKTVLELPFKEYIFKRYEKFLKETSWLKENFPKVDKIVHVHGACNYTNALYSDGKVFLIDLCDSYPGPKECDLGSLYFAECFEFSLLKQACKTYLYDLKSSLFFAVLYGEKQLGKDLNEKKRELVEIRVSHLKSQYREIE